MRAVIVIPALAIFRKITLEALRPTGAGLDTRRRPAAGLLQGGLGVRSALSTRLILKPRHGGSGGVRQPPLAKPDGPSGVAGRELAARPGYSYVLRSLGGWATCLVFVRLHRIGPAPPGS
jgi:hypothetical protein